MRLSSLIVKYFKEDVRVSFREDILQTFESDFRKRFA